MLLSAAVLPLPTFAMSSAGNYKMGLQLFTIRDAMAQDPIGSLKKVRSLGFEDLEIYGYDEEKGSYYGFKAAEFKKILDGQGLTASSGHYGFSPYFKKPAVALERYVDKCIGGARALDQKYITWPWLAPELRSIENFKILSEKLNVIGGQVNKAGLGFAYHNHDFEFTDHGGEQGYELIMRETDPGLVKLQLDLYWVMHSSKRSPAELIARQPERFVMWHIKDMDKVSRDYTELGNGSIDYDNMLQELDQSGLQNYFLEQGGNYAVNSMQSITDSAAFFKKRLQKYL